ncbi:MAG: hypothetical protein AAF458_11735 [Pseudomonadota bacterium]
MSTASDDQHLEQYLAGGSELTDAYAEIRESTPALPPMHLDARVLGAARQSVAPEPLAPIARRQSFSRHWALPVSLAAVVVLSVSLVVVIQPTSQTNDQRALSVPSNRTDAAPLETLSTPGPVQPDAPPPARKSSPGGSRSLAPRATLRPAAPTARTPLPAASANGSERSPAAARPGGGSSARSLRPSSAAGTAARALKDEEPPRTDARNEDPGSTVRPLNRAVIDAERARQQAQERRAKVEAEREVSQRRQEADAINAARSAREDATRQALEQTQRAEQARAEARRRLAEQASENLTRPKPGPLSESLERDKNAARGAEAAGRLVPEQARPAPGTNEADGTVEPEAAGAGAEVPAAATPAGDVASDQRRATRAYQLALEIVRDHLSRGRLDAARAALTQLQTRFPGQPVPSDIEAALAQ